MLAAIPPAGSLRVLVLRTATVSVLAALVIAFVAQAVSYNLVQARFQDEAGIIANTATTAIEARGARAPRGARFVAGLPPPKPLATALASSPPPAAIADTQS